MIPLIGMRQHFVAGECGDAIEKGAFGVGQRVFKNHRRMLGERERGAKGKAWPPHAVQEGGARLTS